MARFATAIEDLDPMTGLLHRKAFSEACAKALQAAAGSGHWMSLMLIDVDEMIKFNYSHGYLEGDECLLGIAHAISDSVRANKDFLGRIGGEEFAVLMPATDPASALPIAEGVRSAVVGLGYKHSVADWPGLEAVTVSIGVASMMADRADVTLDRLLRAADNAVYIAKSSAIE